MSLSSLNQGNQNIISPSVNMEELKREKPIKLGIMASGSGTNFDAVANAIADGKLNAEIPVLVYKRIKQLDNKVLILEEDDEVYYYESESAQIIKSRT